MIARITFSILFCLSSIASQSQAIMQDQLWTDNQYRIIMYRDSSFTFSKIDEPMKDMIGGSWLYRADTFYLFSADTFRLLLFSFFEQDSMHKKIVHIDPRIYNSYSGLAFPKYFYLNKTYYNSGNICSAYSFASCDETKKCYLNINHFSEKGSIIYKLDINLKKNIATYVEFSSESYKMPKVIVSGKYKNGKKIGKWFYAKDKIGPHE